MSDGHVIVVGCGRVGSSLASRLRDDGFSVAVVDRQPAAFKRLGDLDVTRIAGVGFDRVVLQDAGVERAVAVAAVTNGDNSNILIARVARERFGVEQVVARIYDPRRAAIYERLGISTIATVQWTTDRLHQKIAGPAEVTWTDPTARVVVVEREVRAEWAARSVSDLEGETGARVVSITRLGAAGIPDANQLLQEGDIVHLAIASDRLSTLAGELAGGEAGV